MKSIELGEMKLLCRNMTRIGRNEFVYKYSILFRFVLL